MTLVKGKAKKSMLNRTIIIFVCHPCYHKARELVLNRTIIIFVCHPCYHKAKELVLNRTIVILCVILVTTNNWRVQRQIIVTEMSSSERVLFKCLVLRGKPEVRMMISVDDRSKWQRSFSKMVSIFV